MSTNSEPSSNSMRYESINQADVPKGRDGKHKKIVIQILNDIDLLEPDHALKVPLAELPDSKENIRSALNRATRQRGVELSTSSDADFLYIWKTGKSASGPSA
jgi:hypothetical protein